MTNMRLILCANSTSKIIAPIRSRCLLVRVAAPTDDQVSTFLYTSAPSGPERADGQMVKVLQHVAKKERFSLPSSASDAITASSLGNLRKALLMFEAMRMQQPDLSGSIEVAKPDWETYCGKVADSIMKEQTPQKLLEVRGKVYELLSHCIPPGVVLKVSEQSESLEDDQNGRIST